MGKIEDLVEEGYQIKAQLDTYQERLRDINKQIESLVDFNGKSTARVETDNVKITITRKINTSWDQGKLEQVSDKFDFFKKAFKVEYKPIAKAMAVYVEAHPEFKKATDWAKTEKPGAPQVKYELIEKDGM